MDEHRVSTRRLVEEVRQLEAEGKADEGLERLRSWAEEVPVEPEVRHQLIRLCLASSNPGTLKVAARHLSLILLERRLAAVK